MAIIRSKELKELAPEELDKRVGELRLELAKNRAQIAIGGAVKNPGKLREQRRTIAKLLTEKVRRRK